MTLQKLIKANKHKPVKIKCNITDYMLINMPVTVSFFYDYQIQSHIFMDALSHVLSDFPVFSGRLKIDETGLCIDCNNEGIDFIENTHDCSLADAMEKLLDIELGIGEVHLFNVINATHALEDAGPILSFCINYFNDDTMCLGISYHHCIGDMQTLMSFMQALSSFIANKEYTLPMIAEDRNLYINQHIKKCFSKQPGIRYLDDNDIANLTHYISEIAPDKMPIQFYFSNEELGNIKSHYQALSNQYISTNDVLCAHMFSVISSCDQDHQSRCFSLAINYRHRVGLPESLLGNSINSINIDFEKSLPVEKIAQRIRAEINQFSDSHMDYFSNQELVENNGGMGNISRFIANGIDPVKGMFLVTNWNKFGVYDIDFGQRPPIYFTEMSSSPIPWVSSICEGFHGNGLLFTSLLPTSIVKKLMHQEQLKIIHEFRNKNEQLPDFCQSLSWVH